MWSCSWQSKAKFRVDREINSDSTPHFFVIWLKYESLILRLLSALFSGYVHNSPARSETIVWQLLDKLSTFLLVTGLKNLSYNTWIYSIKMIQQFWITLFRTLLFVGNPNHVWMKIGHVHSVTISVQLWKATALLYLLIML